MTENLLPWLALLYWDEQPQSLRFDSYDILLAILMIEL